MAEADRVAPSLGQLLGAHYSAIVLGRGSPAAALVVLREALMRDPELRETAHATLQRINALAAACGDLEQRSFIDSVHRKALVHALEGL